MIFGCYSFLPNLIKVSSGHSKNRKALMPPVLCPIHIQLSSCVILPRWLLEKTCFIYFSAISFCRPFGSAPVCTPGRCYISPRFVIHLPPPIPAGMPEFCIFQVQALSSCFSKLQSHPQNPHHQSPVIHYRTS